MVTWEEVRKLVDELRVDWKREWGEELEDGQLGRMLIEEVRERVERWRRRRLVFDGEVLGRMMMLLAGKARGEVSVAEAVAGANAEAVVPAEEKPKPKKRGRPRKGKGSE